MTEEEAARLLRPAKQAMTQRIIDEVRPYTVVPDEGIAAAIDLTIDAIERDIPGDLVECGVWRGGSSFAMLLAQRYAFGEIRRPVHMFDSFAGMSPPSPEDGEHARWWYARSMSGVPDPDGQNFVRASIDEVCANLARFGLEEHAHLHPGWLADTLPAFAPTAIAVLRVDCDWYEPVKSALNGLGPRVSTGGVIILDDYYVWEGCTLATHEYLAQTRLPWLIRTVENQNGCWMQKPGASW